MKAARDGVDIPRPEKEARGSGAAAIVGGGVVGVLCKCVSHDAEALEVRWHGLVEELRGGMSVIGGANHDGKRCHWLSYR